MTKNGALRKTFLWRLPIQSNLKPSRTEKRKDKAKYLAWNSITLKFVKKTSMPNPAKSLKYIKCHSLSSPRPVKRPINSIGYNCKKICSWSRRPKTILEIRSLFKSFSKTLLTTKRCRPFPNFLKYRNHRWNLPTIWKTRLL